ncbi:MAG TPA: hypothetical protein VMJ10_05200 [Kofleriaceae bacterium]|nr:hypothetical protein [Kofleriaceae bacterium]
MAFQRPFLTSLAALPLTFAACSSSSSGEPKPVGPHYQYVTNQLDVPTSNDEARADGLDLDGNGQPDNQLGMVLATLGGMGFDIQGTVDVAVLEGEVIFLVDFQTQDFMNTTAAGIQVFLGQNPMPVACNSGETATCGTCSNSATTKCESDSDCTSPGTCTMAKPPVCTGCGHQLTGSASFTVDPNGPTNAALSGKIVAGTFTGGPGDLSLPLTLAGVNLQLDLIGARAKCSGITATAIGTATADGCILGGALTQDELDNQVLPAIQTALVPLIQRDCCGLSTSPGGATCNPSATPACGCTSGSTGSTILGLFDTMPKDCTVSLQEIEMNSLIESLLAPDVTIEGKMALSLGIKITTVGATFTSPAN